MWGWKAGGWQWPCCGQPGHARGLRRHSVAATCGCKGKGTEKGKEKGKEKEKGKGKVKAQYKAVPELQMHCGLMGSVRVAC